ncbi:hypothetical protein [Streptomyces sp. NBC_00691]|uniref:hypothetical protein n=1 Tax=Streptomyces sp. NBC_00691 TaxID=2903671 RepID=UPI002E34813F|nr:hypothetical protein [Streptomyces sp. NBC_00691]
MSAHQLPVFALLGAFAVTAAAAWAAAGRRRGAPTIAGALFVLQGALHLLFSLAGSRAGDTGHPAATVPHGTAGTRMPAGAHAMHGTTGADGMAGTHGTAGAHDMSAGGAMSMDMTTGMLAAHLLAALLCGLWLAHGEAAFLALARAALAYAFTPLRPLLARVRVPDAPRRPARRARRSAHRPHTVVLAHALSRRGPPRLSVPRATTLGAHV